MSGMSGFSINPIIQYVSEKVAAPVNKTSDEAIIERAKLTGKPAHVQAYEEFARNQAQIDFLREESDKNAARALGFQSPEVSRIYGEIASTQANAPEPPPLVTPEAPNLAQRAMAILASMFNPRMGLTLQNQPFAVNEQLAREADQRNIADFGRRETRFGRMMNSLNTQLGIAQRDETAQRNLAAGLSSKQQAEASRLAGQSGTLIGKLMSSNDAEANRLSREQIANLKINFERDKATNRLKFDQSKLEAWIKDRANQLAETVRFHTGTLDARDREIAIAQARQDAAELLDQYKIQWETQKQTREEAEMLNKFKTGSATLRANAEKLMQAAASDLYRIQEKRAKLKAQMQVMNDMLASEKDQKKRDEIMRQIAGAKTVESIYGAQEASAKGNLLRAQAVAPDDGEPDVPIHDPSTASNKVTFDDAELAKLGLTKDFTPGIQGPIYDGPTPKTLPSTGSGKPPKVTKSGGGFDMKTKGGNATIRIKK